VGSVALTVSAVLGVVCLVTLAVCSVLGIRPLVVTSGSMSPTITTGSLVLARDTAATEVEVGDVVAVGLPAGGRVMHRVVHVVPAGDGSGQTVLTLKGDANGTPDSQPYVVRRVGEVRLHVPWLGYPITWLSTPLGLVGLGATACGLLVFAFRRTSPPAGRRRVAVLASVPLTAIVAAGTLAPTHAYFVDSGAITSGTIASGKVPKPAEATANPCVVNNPLIGAKTITTRWVVATPPTSRTYTYTALLRETGTNLAVTIAAGIGSATVSTGILSLTLGATYHIDVTVSLSGSVWTDSSTRTAQLGLLGLGWSCGAWT
jgi:signal peptidase I